MSLPSLPRSLFSIVLFFGTLLTFLIPPTQTPDENSHLVRAVMISEGRIGFTGKGDKRCQDVPASLLQFVDAHRYMVFQPTRKYSFSKWSADTHATVGLKPVVRHCYSAQAASPLLYLPQVAGIAAGKLLYALSPLSKLEFNWSAAQYFSRMGNVLALAAAAALACAWAPRFSGVIFAVATLPMTLQAGASAGYDATVIISCLLYFALVAGIAARAVPPSRREIIALLALAFFVAHGKIVYAPMLLLVIALKRWMDWPAFLRLCAGIGVVSLLGVALGSMVFGAASNPQLEALQHQQIEHLARNPFQTPLLVLGSIFENRDFYTLSFLGNLGWLDTNMPVPLLMLIWGTLLCAIVGDALRGPSPLGWVGSSAALGAALISIFGVFLVLYIIWTSATLGPGTSTINGVQGRYFLPLAPFVMASVAASPSAVSGRAAAIRGGFVQVQMTLSLALLTLVTFGAMARYWIPEMVG